MRLRKPTLLMIDDIGEDDLPSGPHGSSMSSSNLRVSSGLQLMLSTNDRFVMNKVPLKYWHIVQREGTSVSVINQRNSRRTIRSILEVRA
jgi:hypothetical protein